jgi:hypothetical protein
MNTPLIAAANVAGGIARVRYSHDAMIDLVIAEPMISQRKIAGHFGFTEGWVSRVFNSDAFLARLAMRKAELTDPTIVASMENRLKGLMTQSSEILSEKLEIGRSPDLAARVLELSSKALGYGARQGNIAVQNNFVVALPPKAADAASWASEHRPSMPVADAVVVSAGKRGVGEDLMALVDAAK